MTYTVSSGTLNSSIPYHTITNPLEADVVVVVVVVVVVEVVGSRRKRRRRRKYLYTAQ